VSSAQLFVTSSVSCNRQTDLHEKKEGFSWLLISSYAYLPLPTNQAGSTTGGPYSVLDASLYIPILWLIYRCSIITKYPRSIKYDAASNNNDSQKILDEESSSNSDESDAPDFLLRK
jgi:hypothetical protein